MDENSRNAQAMTPEEAEAEMAKADEVLDGMPVEVDITGRIIHSPIKHILQFFKFEHLPGHLQSVSRPMAECAEMMAKLLPQNPELTAGLRKLLEAKDCFVRAKLAGKKVDGS